MFINLSNHSSDKWSKEMLEAAQQYGQVIDIAFPNVGADWDELKVDEVATQYFEKISQYENPIIMIQGEFTLTYRLVTLCKEKGYKVVSACSERISQEKVCSDGSVNRTSIFKFVRFREY